MEQEKNNGKKFILSPFKLFVFIGILLAIAVAIASLVYLHISWKICYLMGINITTFLFYMYDKQAASRGMMRVPEMVLHLFTLIGGTPMAFLAQHCFKHKTLKFSFRIVFWIIVVIQILAIWHFWNFLVG